MNKTVLVTGGAIRVGRALCLSLADAGWNVAIHYHRSQQEAEELSSLIMSKGRKAWLLQADLSDDDAVSALFPTLMQQGVTPDALINNASLFEKNSLSELSRKNWQRHMDVNCFAPLQLTRDFAASYQGHEGNVINITDGMEGWSLSPTFLSYALSKKALADATRLLARTLAPRIRINAIAPGPVLEGTQDKPETFAKLRQIIPLQRTGSPEDICNAVLYILRSPSLTGQTLTLSGGLDLALQW